MSNKVPQIRFNGYSDAWVQRELSDIAEVRTGKAFSSSDFTDDGEFRVVTNKNIQDKTTGKIFTGDRINVSDQTVIDKYVLSGENILVTMDGANIGKVGMYTDSGALLAQRVGRLNSAVLNFVYQIVSDEKFISRMNQLAVGNAIKHISLEQIGRYEIAVPESETEKTKIGQLLSNLDNLIAANQRKLDLLKEQKKGYLQKMFPKNGAKVPELRFAEFADDWEERKLGDVVGEIQSGNRLPKDSLTNGDVPYVVAQTKNDGVFTKIARGTLDYNGKPMKLFPGNSISFSIDNPEAMFYRNAEFYTSNIMRVIHEDHLTHEQYVFILENMKRFIRGYDWSRKFSGPVVSNLEYLQPSEEEQQKIGSFFKQLDGTIDLHQRKLEKLQELKKGYLQKMFC